jgi:bacterioferritin-associated ferredoxin
MAATLSDAASVETSFPSYPGAKAYLCHCLRVTEQDVRDAVEAGVVNEVRDAMQQTGAGTGCMACRCALRDVIEDCRRRAAATRCEPVLAAAMG